MITLEQAKKLKYGDILHHVTAVNADGTPRRFKVNGQVKTWKRDPSKVRVPLKHGLYGYGYLVNDALEGAATELSLDEVELPDEEPTMQDFADALERVWNNIAEDILGMEGEEDGTLTRDDVFGICADAPFESNCGRDHKFYMAFFNRDRSKDEKLKMLAFPHKYYGY